MIRFFLRKARDYLTTLLLMSLLVFLVFYILPGDPVKMILGTEATAEKRAALEEALGLGQTPAQRYLDSLRGLFSRSDPSLSLRFQRPVRELIASRFSLTLRLSLLSFLIVCLLSVPLAILCYKKPGGVRDRFISLCSQLFMSIPGFFMGFLLILLFAFILGVYKPGSYVPPEKGFWRSLASLLLPAFALALPKLSQAAQFLRSALIQGKNEDFIRTAKSKGATESRILWRHLMRNSLAPLMTALSLILAELMTGSLVVEQIFVLPGAGRLLFAAINSRDLPLAQGLILTMASLVVLINLLSDLVNRLIDPRLGTMTANANGDEDDV